MNKSRYDIFRIEQLAKIVSNFWTSKKNHLHRLYGIPLTLRRLQKNKLAERSDLDPTELSYFPEKVIGSNCETISDKRFCTWCYIKEKYRTTILMRTWYTGGQNNNVSAPVLYDRSRYSIPQMHSFNTTSRNKNIGGLSGWMLCEAIGM